jgi:two-component system sensor histidine kinase KdpD
VEDPVDREPARPDPDSLLRAVKEQEREASRGRLRIFFGYAAGVGKTYAMLEAARALSASGVRVVVGVVETHERVDTNSLLKDLKAIPLRPVEYRGVTLREMDIDGVLAARPDVALVDELAHTNAPGSRHPKRWMDVEELLDAGIDVFTTLNVQHLESVRETVAKITKVVVAETIPDRVFEEASEIRVVDIPTRELLQRFKEGKVYFPDVASHAVQHFFQHGNLIALRQIALRRAAERIDRQMRDHMVSMAIAGPWPARERLLVIIDPTSEMGDRLVRSGKRLADELGAEWETVIVGADPGERWGADAYRKRVAGATALAESLGARSNPTPLPRHATTIIDYARRNNVTRVIVGWGTRPRWHEFLRREIAPSVIRQSGPIDVLVVTDDAPPALPWLDRLPWKGSAAQRYALAALIVAAATAASAALDTHLSPTNLVMVYLLGTVIASIRLGMGPAVLCASLSVLAFDFFFVTPRYTMVVDDSEYLITFGALLLVGIVISVLVSQTQERAQTAHHREAVTTSLFSLSKDLAAAPDEDAILARLIAHIQSTFGYSAVVFMERSGRLEVSSASEVLLLGDDEAAVARWAFDKDLPAGAGTDTLPGAQLRYLPLRGPAGPVGVVGFKPHAGPQTMTVEDVRLLESLVSLASLAIGRTRAATPPGGAPTP